MVEQNEHQENQLLPQLSWWQQAIYDEWRRCLWCIRKMGST